METDSTDLKASTVRKGNAVQLFSKSARKDYLYLPGYHPVTSDIGGKYDQSRLVGAGRILKKKKKMIKRTSSFLVVGKLVDY